MKHAFHGGALFEAIGADFSGVATADQVINADVLDAWFDPSPRVLDAIREYAPFLIRSSPPAYADGLVQTISQVRGVPTTNILVGGGSSDLIFTLFLNMINSADRVLILDPMYGEYQHVLEQVIGARTIRHPLQKEQQFRIDLDALLADIQRTQPKLVALVNPNSPTGQYWDQEQVRTLLEHLPPEILVLVDETYIEYVDRSRSVERDVARFDNLIVMKSMSKVYALSGLRVGYVVANTKIIGKLAKLSPPWAVSLAGQMAGIEALNDERYYQQRYHETHQLRADLARQLSELPFLRVYPSVANFLLVELLDQHMSAQQIVHALKQHQIYLRNADSMSRQFEDKFLRVAIKPAHQQQRIVATLRAYGAADRIEMYR